MKDLGYLKYSPRMTCQLALFHHIFEGTNKTEKKHQTRFEIAILRSHVKRDNPYTIRYYIMTAI